MAIGLAMATRRVVPSLLAGVICGAVLLALRGGGAPELALPDLWASLADRGSLSIFAFTLLMGAMVGVMQRAGGMLAVVERLRGVARDRRRGQLLTWLLGLLVFFDDYANTLLLGGTLRPLADRLRISREKLAYLVDSTAAPVAGLAPISTWVAVEIGFIASGLTLAGLSGDGLALFLASIPFRFYVLYALVLVPLIGASGRDFGPMLRAEARAGSQPPEVAADLLAGGDPLAPPPGRPRYWIDAALPIGVTVAAIVVALAVSGAGADPPPRGVASAIAAGDSYLALLVGSVAGLLTIVALVAARRLLAPRELLSAAGRGARLMLPALVILWLAWTLAAQTERLETAAYLAGMARHVVRPEWLPTVVFLLAAVVSFATGTSFGTMGILMPLAIGLTTDLLAAAGQPVAADNRLLVAVIGSVLAGAIFGDHCSPVSDTTILSSTACGCDHAAHVWTQIPYALLAGGVAIICGTLPAGYGISPIVLLPLGVALLAVVVWTCGRPTPA